MSHEFFWNNGDLTCETGVIHVDNVNKETQWICIDVEFILKII